MLSLCHLALFVRRVSRYEPAVVDLIKWIVEHSHSAEDLRRACANRWPHLIKSHFAQNFRWHNLGKSNLIAEVPRVQVQGAISVAIYGPKFTPYHGMVIPIDIYGWQSTWVWIRLHGNTRLYHPNIVGDRIECGFSPHLALLDVPSMIAVVCTRFSGLLSQPCPYTPAMERMLENSVLDHLRRTMVSHTRESATHRWGDIWNAAVRDQRQFNAYMDWKHSTQYDYYRNAMAKVRGAGCSHTPELLPRPSALGHYIPLKNVKLFMPSRATFVDLTHALSVHDACKAASEYLSYPQSLVTIVHRGSYIGTHEWLRPLHGLGVRDGDLLIVDILGGGVLLSQTVQLGVQHIGGVQ